jgi:hypothetical protein
VGPRPRPCPPVLHYDDEFERSSRSSLDRRLLNFTSAEDRDAWGNPQRQPLHLPQTEKRRTGFARKTDASGTAGNGNADRAASIILLVEEAAGVAVGARAGQLRRLIDLSRRRGAVCRHLVTRRARLREMRATPRLLLGARSKVDRTVPRPRADKLRRLCLRRTEAR